MTSQGERESNGTLRMQISPARQTAYRILLRIEGYGGFAADLLQSAAVTKLSDADRRLTTELVMGTLRWQRELDYQIERLSGKSRGYFDPEIRTILRLGVYQIRFLRKIPKPAAVDDLVELATVGCGASIGERLVGH